MNRIVIIALAMLLAGCATSRQPKCVEATITDWETRRPLLKEAYFESTESETNAECVVTLDINIPSGSHHAFSISLRRAFTHDPDGVLRLPEAGWNRSICADGVTPTGKGIGESLSLWVESGPDDLGIRIHITCSWSGPEGSTQTVEEVLPVLVGPTTKWKLPHGVVVTTGSRNPKK